jgi:small multidrug resistance family-3 protein
MTVLRSFTLFVVAALFEIGGAWLVWQGLREHKGRAWIGGGVIALGLYGVVATFQSDDNFGRILAAYGGIFVAGSIAWGMVADGYRPDATLFYLQPQVPAPVSAIVAFVALRCIRYRRIA